MKYILLIISFSIYVGVNAQSNGLGFNSSNNNGILVPNDPLLDLTTDFTIEFNLKTSDQVTGEITILQDGNCNALFSYHLTIRSDRTVSFVASCVGNCSNYSNYRTTSSVNLIQCATIAMTYSSVGVEFYFDGVLQPGGYVGAGPCGNIAPSNEDLRICHYEMAGGSLTNYAHGIMDELRIWDRVLTIAELTATMNSELTGNEADLLLYYNFNNVSSGPLATVQNMSALTGSVLNGTTASNSPSTPSAEISCISSSGVGIVEESLSTPILIKLYPNPASSIITIEIEDPLIEKLTIDIINNQGKLIERLVNPQANSKLDVSSYPSGMYIMRAYSNESMVVQKFIVE